jgi:amino acid adenylation domain-containing protein
MSVRYRYVTPVNAFEPFGAEALEQSLPARFAAQVRRFGDRTALRTRDGAISYADLDGLANGVAHAVLDARGPGAEPIGLLVDKGVTQIAALLGILKAGKIATPVDPSAPAARLGPMIERAGIGLVVADAGRLTLARSVSGVDGSVLSAGPGLTEASAAAPPVALGPDDPALIVHTSGSTGHPKGVLHTHRVVLAQIRRLTDRYHLSAEDRLTWLAGLNTAQGVGNVFLALLNGATVYPWDIRQDGLDRLPEWMLAERITFFRSSTSVFRYFVALFGGPDNLPSLRLLTLASDPAYAEDVERFRRFFPRSCLLANVLSSTETWTIAMHLMDHESPLPEGCVPAGPPVDDVEIRLLDADGDPVLPGEPGEITVRSPFLASGYWREPEASRAAFGPDPPGSGVRTYRTGDLGQFLSDGSLVVLGRRDFQVKVRGYRVAVEEIEQALREHPGVKAAAVVARADARNEIALVGYIVTGPVSAPSGAEARDFLRDRLPSQMVPVVIVAVETLPMTAAGKIDRRALPDPDSLLPRCGVVAPRTPIEARVAAIWAEALGVERVGVEDEFLTLGGNSLRATMVIARLAEEFGSDLPVAALLQAPTVAETALLIVAHLMARLPDADEPSTIQARPGVGRPPTEG